MRILEKITARNADISTGSPATIVFLGDSITQGAFDTTRLLSNHINHPTREMHKLFAAYLVDMIVFR